MEPSRLHLSSFSSVLLILHQNVQNQRLTDSTAGGQDRPNGYYGGQPADVFSDILVRSTDSEQPGAVESFVRRLIYTQVLSLIGDSPHRKDRIYKAASE